MSQRIKLPLRLQPSKTVPGSSENVRRGSATNNYRSRRIGFLEALAAPIANDVDGDIATVSKSQSLTDPVTDFEDGPITDRSEIDFIHSKSSSPIRTLGEHLLSLVRAQPGYSEQHQQENQQQEQHQPIRQPTSGSNRSLRHRSHKSPRSNTERRDEMSGLRHLAAGERSPANGATGEQHVTRRSPSGMQIEFESLSGTSVLRDQGGGPGGARDLARNRNVQSSAEPSTNLLSSTELQIVGALIGCISIVLLIGAFVIHWFRQKQAAKLNSATAEKTVTSTDPGGPSRRKVEKTNVPKLSDIGWDDMSIRSNDDNSHDQKIQSEEISAVDNDSYLNSLDQLMMLNSWSTLGHGHGNESRTRQSVATSNGMDIYRTTTSAHAFLPAQTELPPRSNSEELPTGQGQNFIISQCNKNFNAAQIRMARHEQKLLRRPSDLNSVSRGQQAAPRTTRPSAVKQGIISKASTSDVYGEYYRQRALAETGSNLTRRRTDIDSGAGPHMMLIMEQQNEKGGVTHPFKAQSSGNNASTSVLNDPMYAKLGAPSEILGTKPQIDVVYVKVNKMPKTKNDDDTLKNCEVREIEPIEKVVPSKSVGTAGETVERSKIDCRDANFEDADENLENVPPKMTHAPKITQISKISTKTPNHQYIASCSNSANPNISFETEVVSGQRVPTLGFCSQNVLPSKIDNRPMSIADLKPGSSLGYPYNSRLSNKPTSGVYNDTSVTSLVKVHKSVSPHEPSPQYNSRLSTTNCTSPNASASHTYTDTCDTSVVSAMPVDHLHQHTAQTEGPRDFREGWPDPPLNEISNFQNTVAPNIGSHNEIRGPPSDIHSVVFMQYQTTPV